MKVTRIICDRCGRPEELNYLHHEVIVALRPHQGVCGNEWGVHFCAACYDIVMLAVKKAIEPF